jgi:hypothetical protein
MFQKRVPLDIGSGERSSAPRVNNTVAVNISFVKVSRDNGKKAELVILGIDRIDHLVGDVKLVLGIVHVLLGNKIYD